MIRMFIFKTSYSLDKVDGDFVTHLEIILNNSHQSILFRNLFQVCTVTKSHMSQSLMVWINVSDNGDN